jgi:hypothetical protein
MACVSYPSVFPLSSHNQFSEPPAKERIAMTRLNERIEKIYKLNYDCLKVIVVNPANVIPIEPEIQNQSRGLLR